jgi:DNA-binding MarR family transcriptional regulator
MNSAPTFDAMIASSGRLRILTTLVAQPRMEMNFVRLRHSTGLTDGNLATHTRRLEAAGLVRIDKSFQDRKPVTQVQLTAPGRSALELHARQLLEALNPSSQETSVETAAEVEVEEPWID